MKNSIALLPLVVAGILSTASLQADNPVPTGGATTINIDNFSFTPPSLTVHPGTKVTWINKDDVPHTVTSVDKKFGSKIMDTDEQFSFTFTAPGTYKYYCKVHPHMTAQITVQ